MNSSPTMLRVTAPLISLAGTICVMTPAWANGPHHTMRGMMPRHISSNRHEIQRLAGSGTVQGVQPAKVRGHVLKMQTLPHHIEPLNPRMNRFNGGSTFLNQNNRVRAIAHGLELDLTSPDRNIVLGDRLFTRTGSYTINEGGEQRTLTAGNNVTAAEYVALQQVIAGDAQSLTVDQSGKGVGGRFTLNSISDGGKTINAAQLVIPSNVTASGDFGRSADGVKVTREFVNFGTVEAYSTKPNHDTATIAARDISNESGALISTVLDLSLRAENDLNNAGTIASAGNIDLSAKNITNTGNISAGGNLGLTATDISNHGSLSSTNGNVMLNGIGTADLAVNNTLGTISALNGAISVRTDDYTGMGSSTIYGGDLLSKQLNLYSGQGSTDVTVNKLTGTIASSGTAAHVSANTDTLVIGSQCLVGDPTYYNTGDIVLAGDVVVGEDLAIIAGGNITTSTTNLNIMAQGFNINIIAGANVSAGSGEIPPAGGPGTLPAQSIGSYTNNTTADVSFTGASSTGGNIDFTGATTQLIIETDSFVSDTKGGNLTLAAYQGSGGGKILLPTASTINTSGNGAGDNGSVTVAAGSTAAGLVIQLGGVIATGGAGVGGKISINSSQPSFDSGSTMTFDTAGKISTGNRIVPNSVISTDADVSVAEILGASADVDVVGGHSVSVSTFLISDGQSGDVNGGNISLFSFKDVSVGNLISVKGANNGNGGNVLILSGDGGTVNLAGSIDTSGGPSGGNGGAISIGSPAGKVILNGAYNANTSDPSGTAGDITITANDDLDLSNVTGINANAFGSGSNGNITLTDISQIIGGLNISSTRSAGNSNAGSISVTALAGGINSGGQPVSLNVDGSLNLSLGIPIINTTPGSVGAGGDILLKGSMNINNSSALTPLVLETTGNNGNGGSVTYSDTSVASTFLGVPAKIKKGPANFLSILASAGGDGNGGDVDIQVGGNLFVDTANLTNSAVSTGVARNGGDVKLVAGTTAPKGGSLIMVGGLNTDGLSGGASGNLTLSSTFKNDFAIGSTKKLKNGVSGPLISTDGTIDITNTISGIQIAGPVITSDTLSLSAAGKGAISTAKGVTLNHVINVLFSSDLGRINAMLDVGTLSVVTNSSATLSNSFLSPMLVLGALAQSINISGSSTIIIATDVSTTKGDANFSTSDSSIALLPNHTISAVDGDITLQAASPTTGSIDIGGNSQILTSGQKGGNITLAVGALPKKLLNPIAGQPGPPSVTNIGKGQTFFGVAPAGLSFTGTVNLISENKNVVLNNATTNAQPISIGDIGQTVTIHADPPSRISGVSVGAPQLDTGMLLTGLTSQIGSTQTTVNYSAQSINGITFGDNLNLLGTINGVDVNSRSLGSLTANGTDGTNSVVAATDMVKPVAISSLFDEFYSTGSSLYGGTVGGCIWSDEELGLSETTMIGRNENSRLKNSNSSDTAALRKGAILFAPSKDAKVNTPFGTVEIARDAVAFVVVDDARLAVYDLHDSKKASVTIKSGTHETQLSPGRCAVFSKSSHSEFEHSNPLPSVGYRSISSHSYGNGVRVFDGEFSTLSAINSVPPLQAISASTHRNAKRMLDHIVKTSAILFYLGANSSDFRVYAQPSVTAMRVQD